MSCCSFRRSDYKSTMTLTSCVPTSSHPPCIAHRQNPYVGSEHYSGIYQNTSVGASLRSQYLCGGLTEITEIMGERVVRPYLPQQVQRLKSRPTVVWPVISNLPDHWLRYKVLLCQHNESWAWTALSCYFYYIARWLSWSWTRKAGSKGK